MPKQIYKIDRFEGGLNTSSDPRDIAENECSSLTSAMVDELGIVRTMGCTTEYPNAHRGKDTDNLARPTSSTITPGYGLYQWSHDRVDGHTGGSSISATSDAETGANYLAFSDADAHSSGKLVRIYSVEDNTWGAPITGLNDNTAGTRKDVFYSVDGALRVCDSEFGNSNASKWYGYIDRILFQSISDTVPTDQWYLAAQNISSPSDDSQFDQAIETVTTSTGHSLSVTGISAQNSESTEAACVTAGVVNMMGGIVVTVTITTASFSDIPDVDDFAAGFSITTGSANLSSNAFLGTLGQSHKTDVKSEYGVASSGATKDVSYTFSFGDYFHDGTTVGDDMTGGETGFGIRTEIVSGSTTYGSKIASVVLKSVVITEQTVSDNNSHAATADGGLSSNNLHLEAQFAAPDSGTALGWGKVWEHGVSFIYDEKQESLVRRMFDSTSSDTTEHDNTGQPTHCPTAKLYVKHGTSSSFNRRITGAVWYIRESSGGGAASNDWTAQIEYDFIKGVSRVLSSGYEADCTFNQHAEEYEFEVDQDNLLSPNLTDTYRSRTGVSSDETAIKARYSSSCNVGRRVYIGNVEIDKEDGTKEIKADAMIKSPVNRFDTFPSSSIVEAAINDGESIVALEEFADRILQFKEQTLYIINVSQDIEFLEDVHKYKGALHPASICKTDYGIAWANTQGCFLYDGKQVINLLEKGGRRLISESDWEDFLVADKSFAAGTVETFLTPMVGFIPNKRQIVIYDDITTGSSSEPRMYLYDMVTQSWARGSDDGTNRQIDIIKTNFVNDWDGNLMYFHTDNIPVIWLDKGSAGSEFEFITKDIDFGEPGRRKKVYKILVTYDSGNATSHVQVDYGVDGDTTFAYDFANGTQITSAPELDTANGWKVAELKPDVASEANNVKSIRLRFATDGAVPLGFKINDISIIYRMKPVN